MKLRTKLPHLVLAILLLTVSLLMSAVKTGKITGTITDKKTGQGLPGATVMIDGTSQGSKTDVNGQYIILNVPPGTYDLKITNLGYEATLVKNVTVKADETTEMNIALNSAICDLGKVTTVGGERKDIDFNETGTVSGKSKERIMMAPVADVGSLLQRETGLTRGNNRQNPPSGYSAPCIPNPNQPPPAHGGTAIVNGEPYDAMFFKHYGTNPFIDTEDDHFSTFAIDVDDASYVMTRSYLDRGDLPPADAVRVEEFVNRFDYDYPNNQSEPFSIAIDGAPSKFGQNCELLRVGIKARRLEVEERKPANLIFVIDISGSMAREDRLGLVKQSLMYLVDQLNYNDQVGIIVYGSNGRIHLQPTPASNRSIIKNAIQVLSTDGATNAEEGLKLGYQMADRIFDRYRTNRIILCSDGVANVGRTGPDELLKKIKKFADRGITLTTVGFGMGNYNDILMEKLGNKGNGFYAYVDGIDEARRVFVDNLEGTLQVVARDVKIQVDFNPEVVKNYRLLGYENRDVEDHKFRDDTEDGGEIGPGHQVTALYEIKFHNKRARGNLGRIYVRYKDPETFAVSEVSRSIDRNVFVPRFEMAAPDFQLAAASAEFAEILKNTVWARNSSLASVRNVVQDVLRRRIDPDTRELLRLIESAERLKDQRADNDW